ncbi:31405_t:CDS:2, partial [Gigaspora margarita]
KEITPLHVTSANNLVITKEIAQNLKDSKTSIEEKHSTPKIVQKIEMPHTIWEKDNDLENQFQWYTIPEIIDSQKEIITKETITKEKITRKKIIIIGKIVTLIIEEDITT